MDNTAADVILRHLATVETERSTRRQDPSLAERVDAVKRYQQRRFELTYKDLLAHPRYAGAANFFLAELYGPLDFTQRDQQFARIVPALVRLFPREVVRTVESLAALHALSETLDTTMGTRLSSSQVDAPGYVMAWQSTADASTRERQICLMEEVAMALDALTASPVLRHSLRLMRGPARAAGLGALQTFLEAGFETFRAMRGAEEFTRMVGQRERNLAQLLFENPAESAADLRQLPPRQPERK